MKHLFWLLLAAPTLLFAQSDIDFTISEPFKDAKRSGNLYQTYTTDQNQVVLVRTGKKQILVDIFDEQFQPVFQKSIERNKKEGLFGSILRGNELTLISVYYPTTKERIVTAHRLDLATGKHRAKTLFNKTIEKTGKLFNFRAHRQTDFAVSKNDRYFVIGMDNQHQNLASYELNVFDVETLERVYRKRSRARGDKLNFRANDLMIDNAGVCYFLGKEYEGKFFDLDRDADYDYLLTRADAEGLKTERVDMGSEQYIVAMRLLDAKNHVRAVGMYGKRRGSEVNGTVVFTFDKETLDVAAEKRSDIPKEMYADLFNEAKTERKNQKQKGIRRTYINHINEADDGTLHLSAQEYFVTQSTDRNGNVTYTYHYRNMLHFSINPIGELNWGRGIFFKRSQGNYALNHLYFSFVRDGKLHVVFNGARRDKERSNDRVKASGKLTALTVYVYDENGEVERVRLRDNTLGEPTFFPQYGAVTRDGRFITLNNRRGRRQFILIEPGASRS